MAVVSLHELLDPKRHAVDETELLGDVFLVAEGQPVLLAARAKVKKVLGGGTGNVVVINEVSTQGATDVLDNEALYEGGTPVPFVPVFQTEVFAFDDLGIPIDNIEGMTFGPSLPDGRNTLIIVSDNNFSAGQFTQFILLALDIEPRNDP